MGFKGHSRYLMDVVKKSIDLKSFIERESGASLSASGRNTWSGICPLHKDSNPSFTVNHEDNDVWLFHCFGCNAGGTIVDFCMELKGFTNPHEAALYAATREGLKFDESIIAKAVREAKVTTDEQREIDLAHFVVCQNCRLLLKGCNGDAETINWIASVYKSMDKLFDDSLTSQKSFEPFRAESCQRLALLAKLKTKQTEPCKEQQK